MTLTPRSRIQFSKAAPFTVNYRQSLAARLSLGSQTAERQWKPYTCEYKGPSDGCMRATMHFKVSSWSGQVATTSSSVHGPAGCKIRMCCTGQLLA
jgi:hypothetical protein